MMTFNKKCRWRLILRGVLFAIPFLLFLISPIGTSVHHWLDGVSLSFRYYMQMMRSICFMPLCWGAAVLFLLGLHSVWLAGRGAPRPTPRRARIAAIVLACILILPAAYWTLGFGAFLTPALPPFQFAAGLFLTNHPAVLALWWAAGALALHFALPPLYSQPQVAL